MERATSTTAIVFAQTIVESPKNGAISRATAISDPSVADPTTKTSSSSGSRRFPMRAQYGDGPVPTGAGASLPWMDTAALADLDRKHLWHPFTQQRDWACEAPVMIERGDGCVLYDTDGNAYIDGVSSLWCNVHGHRHPAIDAAVRAQLDRIAHSTMLGLSHPAAAELAARLVAIAPPGLERVFYSDNGSTAVEVAVKMAYQFWQQRGQQQRTGFVCLRDAYHGDTIGSVSVGRIDLFHATFRRLLFETHHAEPGDADGLLRLLEREGDRIAAVVIEPLVQGAAGMIVHPEGYLRAVRELCDEFGVLMICDEVAVGFGRTGTMFACEQEDVAPDL